jgi:L-ectoine synthase
MIVRHLKDAQQTDRRVVDPNGNWESTRLLLKDDNMGFSFHMTTIYAGKSFRMHYINHLESVYCVRGKGNIKTLDDNVVYEIEPGTVYALDQHDEHILTAESELELACVFNPPVTGREVHNADGAYELEE